MIVSRSGCLTLSLHAMVPGSLHHFSPVFVSAVLLKVYCSDHTYTTIRVTVAATGREVIGAVADKLGTSDELLLIHLTSAGGESSGRITVCRSSKIKVRKESMRGDRL